jgi:thioredoxin 1
MNNFEGHIKGDKPVIIDFYTDWCQPCKMMEPVLRKVKEKMGDRATILKLNIDKSEYYSQLYNIISVPTLIIFKQGKILWRKNGMASTEEILRHLNFHVS